MFSFFRNGSIKSINVNELGALLGKINLIDIREPNEYRLGHLPTAKNIPMNNILSQPEKYLDKSKEYHIICLSGSRSTRACGILNEKGYNVVNVTGGTAGYNGKLEK